MRWGWRAAGGPPWRACAVALAVLLAAPFADPVRAGDPPTPLLPEAGGGPGQGKPVWGRRPAHAAAARGGGDPGTGQPVWRMHDLRAGLGVRLERCRRRRALRALRRTGGWAEPVLGPGCRHAGGKGGALRLLAR